jgi:hypothetical protein
MLQPSTPASRRDYTLKTFKQFSPRTVPGVIVKQLLADGKWEEAKKAMIPMVNSPTTLVRIDFVTCTRFYSQLQSSDVYAF